ncbi:integrase, partial [Halorubrum sp. SS5]
MSSTRATPDPDDPVGYFLEDLTYHGKTDRTRAAYERVLRRFEVFLDGTEPASATHRDCMAF